MVFLTYYKIPGMKGVHTIYAAKINGSIGFLKVRDPVCFNICNTIFDQIGLHLKRFFVERHDAVFTVEPQPVIIIFIHSIDHFIKKSVLAVEQSFFIRIGVPEQQP